jgi:Cu(I)/Ag(I) efflux system periplasmic protein CusF
MKAVNTALAILLILALAATMVPTQAADKGQTHKAVGVVKKIDLKTGTATLAHEPVKSMKWPSMTMAFQVQDKAVLAKLAEGRKVEFEFEQRGKDYVITGVR